MAKRKIRSSRGFTLVEMLCTVVVLVLISALMAIGVRTAVQSFRKSVMSSESRVLCTTLRTIVSDELRYSSNIEQSNDKWTYFSQSYGGQGSSFSTDENGQVVVVNRNNEIKNVLSAKSYSYGMRANVNITDYDADTRIFSATVTVTDQNGKTLAETDFQVERLNTSQ